MATKAAAKAVDITKSPAKPAPVKAAPAVAGAVPSAKPAAIAAKPAASAAKPAASAAKPAASAAKPAASVAKPADSAAKPAASAAKPAASVAKPAASAAKPAIGAAKSAASKQSAAAPVKPPVAEAVARPVGGAAVSSKSAAEKLATMRAAATAKAEQRAKIAATPAPPPALPAVLVAAPKPYVPGGPRPGPSFSAGRPGFPPGGGPNVKPMPKPSGGKHFGFKALEYVVYPAHGVGQIVSIEEQQVAGLSLELFVVNFAKDKLTLKVPAPKVANGAIRKLADAALVQKSLDCLTGRARIKRTMWSRRAQEYEAKINSGDLIAIAEVVRDLYRSDAQPEQSYSERQLYEAALDRMAREIAAVQKLTDTEALKVLDNQLQKGPRRGLKTEGASDNDAEGDAEVEEAA